MADIGGWQRACTVGGFVGLRATAGVWDLLPPSRTFRPRHGLRLREHIAPMLGHLRHAALRWVFVCAFVLMGAFVSVYNYLAYRLSAPPFLLAQSAIGSIFVVYLFGTVSSTIAGLLAYRH